MKKRVIAALLSAAMVVSVLAGCGGSDGETGGAAGGQTAGTEQEAPQSQGGGVETLRSKKQ